MKRQVRWRGRRDTINNDRYPLSPRIQTLNAILANLRPEPAARLCRRSKVYAFSE
jgi:hypothetical protein